MPTDASTTLVLVALALIVRVSAWRRPVRCVPPPRFLMVLVNAASTAPAPTAYRGVAIDGTVSILIDWFDWHSVVTMRDRLFDQAQRASAFAVRAE